MEECGRLPRTQQRNQILNFPDLGDLVLYFYVHSYFYFHFETDPAFYFLQLEQTDSLQATSRYSILKMMLFQSNHLLQKYVYLKMILIVLYSTLLFANREGGLLERVGTGQWALWDVSEGESKFLKSTFHKIIHYEISLGKNFSPF